MAAKKDGTNGVLVDKMVGIAFYYQEWNHHHEGVPCLCSGYRSRKRPDHWLERRQAESPLHRPSHVLIGGRTGHGPSFTSFVPVAWTAECGDWLDPAWPVSWVLR